MSTGTSDAVRFRHHPGRAAAGVIVALSVATLAAVSPWFALLMVPPLGWAAWVWRAGTDADRRGVRVRALFGQRHVPWSQVHELATDGRGGVAARLTAGAVLPLTAVTAADLPTLVDLGGVQPVPPESDPDLC